MENPFFVVSHLGRQKLFLQQNDQCWKIAKKEKKFEGEVRDRS